MQGLNSFLFLSIMATFGVTEAIKIVDDLIFDLSPATTSSEMAYDEFRTQWGKLQALEFASFLEQFRNGKVDGDQFQIFDVRDNLKDFKGGNIISAQNIPCDVFRENLGNLFNEYYDCQNVIIHCMYSQKRGIQCANWYQRALEELVNNFDNPNIRKPMYSKQYYSLNDVKINKNIIECLKRQKLFVLKGGFNEFLNQCIQNHPNLIENFDKNVWKCDDDGRWVSVLDQ